MALFWALTALVVYIRIRMVLERMDARDMGYELNTPRNKEVPND
jgi:hypothetical protein